MSKRTTRKALDAPMAIATDGTLLISVTHRSRATSPQGLLRAALQEDRDVFIGVAVKDSELPGALRKLEDAAAEIASDAS